MVRTLCTRLCLLVLLLNSSSLSALPLDDIKLPPGFSISVYAQPVMGARSMTLSDTGVLYVGSRNMGNVYAIRDKDGDQRGDTIKKIASNLNTPNGVAFKDGDLYVAEISRVLVFKNIESGKPDKPNIFLDGLPTDRHHGWKFIRFSPDGHLFVPVGAPCNVCLSENPVFASILKVAKLGKTYEIFAHGVRNTVGFDWHPTTNELWFTDNGRDWLGDDSPEDELNHAPKPGMHFGFPFCHAGNVADPEFGKQKACREFTPPAQKLGPHVASLGMRFYTGTQFPKTYQGNIFIAERGSWNRSTPLGYRITHVPVKNSKAEGYEVFAEGWLDKKGKAWGRPVDVLVMPDGALLVSDEKAGAIYRIAYSAPAATDQKPPSEATSP